MAGAGISTSAGIPDFRSPGTGLYDNLQKYDLPYPEAIFTLDYLRSKPEAFFTLAKELYPGNFDPTPCHYFIKLLQDKGVLLRHYTQNIDTLERAAGVRDDLLVEAHGSFAQAACIDCSHRHDTEWVKSQIDKDAVPRCESCGGIVKPSIVFFGEDLPRRFGQLVSEDFEKCDLLIVLGTSLTVHPFAGLATMPKPEVPRLLINRDSVGERDILNPDGFDFIRTNRDARYLGSCDDGVWHLARGLGWASDFEALLPEKWRERAPLPLDPTDRSSAEAKGGDDRSTDTEYESEAEAGVSSNGGSDTEDDTDAARHRQDVINAVAHVEATVMASEHEAQPAKD
ncbi:uncharacterized protein MONBRDRAFT_28881 [Monosiga brevicollis MX1]|uniref:NAD-dependent protein deacetylase n=1 Tax=Monosiga brevicollis TaxID=81824 RepID=A9V9C1_MONBE|nr:uncharacterized protein MONBRDRAFT_28881 [Monosiga brevicollis MX1]EDQ85835.1 predicted protein [Monosiga brevicollis MX1]|eukprot:XP_001749314.1 hypothetical protein [Monosiga brevicollis MX1]